MPPPSTSIPSGQTVEHLSVGEQSRVRVKVEPHSPKGHEQPHIPDFQAYVPKFEPSKVPVTGSESQPTPKGFWAYEPLEPPPLAQPSLGPHKTSQAQAEPNIMPDPNSGIKQEEGETPDMAELDTLPELTMSGALPYGCQPPVDRQGEWLVRDVQPGGTASPSQEGGKRKKTHGPCKTYGKYHSGECRMCPICRAFHHNGRCSHSLPLCKTCGEQHPGKCKPCINCNIFHEGACKPALKCKACGKKQHSGRCTPICKTCGKKRHDGKCNMCSNCRLFHQGTCNMCPIHRKYHPGGALCSPGTSNHTGPQPPLQRQPPQQPRQGRQVSQEPQQQSGASQTDNRAIGASQNMQTLIAGLNPGGLRAFANMLNRAGEEQQDEGPTLKRRRQR